MHITSHKTRTKGNVLTSKVTQAYISNMLDTSRKRQCTSMLWNIRYSWWVLEYLLRYSLSTVKPEIFARPLFREFRDLDKLAEITGREYSNGNRLLSTSLIKPSTKLLVTGNAH